MVPADLPDHLRNPTAYNITDRFEAYSAFRRYARELAEWTREKRGRNEPCPDVLELMQALGTDMPAWFALADELWSAAGHSVSAISDRMT